MAAKDAAATPEAPAPASPAPPAASASPVAADAPGTEKPVQAAPAASAEALPKKLKMEVLYAYYDDNNRFREWKEGDVVADPAEIALLVERKAPFVVLEA